MAETFSHYLMNVSHSFVNSGHLRFGQTCFNVLYELDPDLADSIRATDLDPFYDDNKVPAFLERLSNEWQ
jgi:hypothetical protein